MGIALGEFLKMMMYTNEETLDNWHDIHVDMLGNITEDEHVENQ